jgi:hypothetical protein
MKHTGLATILALILTACATAPPRVREVAVVVPRDLATGQPAEWAVLSPAELAALLAQELPDLPADQPALTDLAMLERATGKKVLWIPPLPRTLREAREHGRLYSDFLQRFAQRHPEADRRPTVGGLLRSIISSETAGKTPAMQVLGWYPAPGESPVTSRGEAWITAQAQAAGLPELLEVGLVTRKYIVLLAAPQE